MENKKTYINGVDVSGCKLYREDNGVIAPDGTAEQTELCYLTNDYCGNNTNCYFKQLAHKTQECERLQQSENEAKEIIAKLKAENKKLKKQICGLRPELKGLIDDTCCKYNIEAKTSY